MSTVEQISEKISEYTKRFEYFPAVEKDSYPDPASPHDMKTLLEKYPNLIFSIDYRCYGTPKEVIAYVEKIGYSRDDVVYYHDKDGVLNEDDECYKDYLEEVESYDKLHSEEIILKSKKNETEVVTEVVTEVEEITSEEQEEEARRELEIAEKLFEEKEIPEEVVSEQPEKPEKPEPVRELSNNEIPILEKGVSYIVEEIKSRLPEFSIPQVTSSSSTTDNSKLDALTSSLQQLMIRVESIESFHISIDEKLNSITEAIDSLDIANDIESSVSEIRDELKVISDKLDKQPLQTPPPVTTRNTLSPRQMHRNSHPRYEEEYQSPISPKRNQYKNNRQVLFNFDNSMSRIKNI